MTFTFPRLSAGIYEIQKNDETVGFIRKQTATKWIVTDVVDTPQHVTKTLKEAKSAAENLIIFDTQKDEDVKQETQDSPVNEELNAKVEGSLNTYRVNPDTQEMENVRPSYFGFEDTEEDLKIKEVSPNYGTPTLDPIMF
jgi:hypothetical protein